MEMAWTAAGIARDRMSGFLLLSVSLIMVGCSANSSRAMNPTGPILGGLRRCQS